MRSIHLFNYDWLYAAEVVDSDASDGDFEPVIVPHSNTILPWHNFDDREYQFVSTYRKRFTLPEARDGRRVYLDFEGVMSAATITINGHTFEEHKGGFVPFSYDITDYLNEDGENLLQVSVDSHERADIPPYGGQVDYLVFGGIYRDVSLRYVHPIYIDNARVKTIDVLTDNPRLEVDVWVKNESDQMMSVDLKTELHAGEIGADGSVSTLAQRTEPLTLAAHSEIMITQIFDDLTDVRLWSLTDPYRYGCALELSHDGRVIDDYGAFAFGFREAQFREEGFYLNGEKVFLRGLNRHQMYPYVGMAVSQRLQARDADIIKTNGCNIVRCSHYPQSKYFLDRCDEIGLLVFEEIPGWQHIGDENWQAISVRDVRAMIERDWNHPSIVVWGVRINESGDNTAFYTKTNQLARELDPTRPTSGVRFWPHSEFLEDVYGYNDFSNGIIEPTNTPWLVTEYNGHMYPTKTFDNEERQVEHVVRHVRVQSQAMGMGGLSGAIGWCAFDYNTHLDFGSGDRVCYHGVLDMHRQPKWAAYVYRSQKSPAEEIVLQAASFWTMGDRAGGGNDPLYVLTNCDAIQVWVGDEPYGTFEPDRENFPYLPHPPITIKGLDLHWGKGFASLHIVGLIDGEAVVEQQIAADSIPQRLTFYAEDSTLHADGMDMTRLVFKIVDQYDNRLPYAIQPVTIDLLEGDAQLIGDNPFALVGGQAALLLRAGTSAGTVRLRASTPRLDPVEITINLN